MEDFKHKDNLVYVVGMPMIKKKLIAYDMANKLGTEVYLEPSDQKNEIKQVERNPVGEHWLFYLQTARLAFKVRDIYRARSERRKVMLGMPDTEYVFTQLAYAGGKLTETEWKSFKEFYQTDVEGNIRENDLVVFLFSDFDEYVSEIPDASIDTIYEMKLLHEALESWFFSYKGNKMRIHVNDFKKDSTHYIEQLKEKVG